MFTDKDWGRPGVKRLFLYFNANPGEWEATEGLIETFWIKPGPANPVQGLRFLFFNLRQLFEPWHMPDMDHIFFQSQRGAYGFFPQDRFWMDWKVFEEGIKRAEVAHRARRFKEARQAYRQALDLYLGDYLEEYPYEDWLRPKRDYLRELYFRSVQRYAKLEQDSGNPLEARRVLEGALFKDLSPLRADGTFDRGAFTNGAERGSQGLGGTPYGISKEGAQTQARSGGQEGLNSA